VIQPLLLVMALMWLITAEPPLYLLYYILTQGAVTFLLYGTLIFHDETTYEYAHIWGLCTLLLASTYVTLAWYFLTKNPKKSIAVVCALLLSFACAFLTYRHLTRHNLVAWLGLGAGTVLAGSGAILYVSASYHSGNDRKVGLILGLLFIAQSVWNLGFVLNSSAVWNKSNYVVPTMLCLSAWGYLGMRLRQQKPAHQ
jgi:hypothetical protein